MGGAQKRKKRFQKVKVVAFNIIEKDDQFLLVQEKKAKVRGKWNLPAGRLKPDEGIIACAKREGEEETGFELKPLYLVMVAQRRSHNLFGFFFKSKIIGGKLRIPETLFDVKWFSLEEIREMAKRGLMRNPHIVRAIEDYKAGKEIPLDSIAIED
ncbi:NUDIX domain-containing protein [Patescibacteria group bacterium]|nr:NUDIX domain-containing protein [Patescibacteria group bacterium]